MQQAAELSVPSPTIEAALDGRFLSGLKEQRVKAAAFYEKYGVHAPAAPSVRTCEDPTVKDLQPFEGHGQRWPRGEPLLAGISAALTSFSA